MTVEESIATLLGSVWGIVVLVLWFLFFIAPIFCWQHIKKMRKELQEETKKNEERWKELLHELDLINANLMRIAGK